MKRRWRLLATLGLLVLVGTVLAHPAVYWPLVGWARGEAFYRGRPSSYWSQEMRHWAREELDAVPPQRGLLAGFLDWLASPLPPGGFPFNDPAGVGVLIDLLPDRNPLCEIDGQLYTVGHQAAHALAHQEPTAWEAVPALAAGLKSSDRTTRRLSVDALGTILFQNCDAAHPNYPVGLKALQAAVADEDSLVEVRGRHFLRQLDNIAAERAERLAREGR